VKWEVRRTKINAYDQGDVPPKFKAEVTLQPTDASEAITFGNLSDLITRAMQEFNVPANAELTDLPLQLSFRWQ
jgi:hypothetical protein